MLTSLWHWNPFYSSSLYKWSTIQYVVKWYLCLTFISTTGCLCLSNVTSLIVGKTVPRGCKHGYFYLSIRFHNSCRRLPETKRHSSLCLHWSCSRFLVVVACVYIYIYISLKLELRKIFKFIEHLASFSSNAPMSSYKLSIIVGRILSIGLFV